LYNRFFQHSIICGEIAVYFDKLTERYDYALSQQPLLSGGFETALIGLKWREITIEGCISVDDRRVYDSFLAAVRGAPKTLLVDDTTYTNCILVESGITTLPDSRIERYVMKFRSVENGQSN
jgi:hypothetical protein